MKKIIKNIFSLLLLPIFGIIFNSKFCADNVNVQNSGEKSAILQMNSNKYGGTTVITNEIKEETILKKTITKTQVTYSIDSAYTGDLKNNFFEYSTIRKEITYSDKQNKTLATLFFEINFRFNPTTEEAKCLSTSAFHFCIAKNCKLEIFSGAENKNTECGRGYATVNFEYDDVTDNCMYEFECGSNGEIKGRVIEE